MRNLSLVFLVSVLLAGAAQAQQTIFNVPSPDVLDQGKLYLEGDLYWRQWETDSERALFGSLRGVYGLGSNFEAGLNAGSFDFRDPSKPFLDLAAKWRPLRESWEDPGLLKSWGVIVGDNAGMGLADPVAGHFRNLVYSSAFAEIAETSTRFSLGPYYATRDVFTNDDRFGMLATVEQPIPGAGFTLAADWYSGDGAYGTVGAIWGSGPWTFYAGYGFSNDGRENDLVTLEVGISF